MYKFDLGKTLTTVQQIHKSGGLPVVWGRHVLSGSTNNEHKYRLQVVHIQDTMYRISLFSDKYIIAMYQDSESDMIQYITENTLVSTGVKINSSEEELFQASLLDTKICSYDDLQIMVELLQYGHDVMSDKKGTPRKLLC